jgi:hypothetical protein
VSEIFGLAGLAEAHRLSTKMKPLGGLTSYPNDSGSLLDRASWSAPKLMFDEASAPKGVYWAWLFKTDKLTNPLAPYYLYYSPDHGTDGSGIYLALALSPVGPFVQYGLVYRDTAAGSTQTETPSIIWDDVLGKVRLFYQQVTAKYGPNDSLSANGVQSTLSATAADGIAFVKDPKFILDIPSVNAVQGDGHCGYFLPFKTDRGWFAYSLCGGGYGGATILWRSNGRADKWTTDYRQLGYNRQLTKGAPLNGRIPAFNHAKVLRSGGVDYWIGRLTSGAFGGQAGDDRIAICQISADYRTLMSRPQIIWEASASWETNDLRSVTFYEEDGVAYVYYTIGGNKLGVITHVL